MQALKRGWQHLRVFAEVVSLIQAISWSLALAGGILAAVVSPLPLLGKIGAIAFLVFSGLLIVSFAWTIYQRLEQHTKLNPDLFVERATLDCTIGPSTNRSTLTYLYRALGDVEEAYFFTIPESRDTNITVNVEDGGRLKRTARPEVRGYAYKIEFPEVLDPGTPHRVVLEVQEGAEEEGGRIPTQAGIDFSNYAGCETLTIKGSFEEQPAHAWKVVRDELTNAHISREDLHLDPMSGEFRWREQGVSAQHCYIIDWEWTT